MEIAELSNTMHTPARVAVVGAGNVGSTFAYTLLLSGLASEIVLIDANRARAEGEAMDISHALPFTPSARVWAGDYSDCADAAITVITAGAAQKPGETRLDLAKKNAAIFQQIVPAASAGNGLLLVATNPVDVLTYAALKQSGLPPHRVIGSGTILDTARFRYLLSRHFDVDAHSIHAYIVGEHGDSEVPVWSLANIAGLRLADFCAAHGVSLDAAQKEEIFSQTRDAAYHIIERKGSTYYAVAAGLVQIVKAILRDENTVLSVSSLISGLYGIHDVCLSLPTIVNRKGIHRVLELQFTDEEQAQLCHSADTLKSHIAALGLTNTH
jgi:L-lactate dehydrogenase